jgi:hypothetical protein
MSRRNRASKVGGVKSAIPPTADLCRTREDAFGWAKDMPFLHRTMLSLRPENRAIPLRTFRIFSGYGSPWNPQATQRPRNVADETNHDGGLLKWFSGNPDVNSEGRPPTSLSSDCYNRPVAFKCTV